MMRCATAAWSKIVILWNSSAEGEIDLHMIQSIHLLSVIDFTSKYIPESRSMRGNQLANFTKTGRYAVPGLRLEY